MAFLDDDDEKTPTHRITQPFLKSWGVQIGAIIGFTLGAMLAALFAGVGAYFVRHVSWVVAFLLVPIGLIVGAIGGRVFNIIREAGRLKRRKKREAREEYEKRRREGRR